MQPSDVSFPSASALVPLAFGLPSRSASSGCSRLACVCFRVTTRGNWSPAPPCSAGFVEGETRLSQVPGPPSFARHVHTPRRVVPPRSIAGEASSPSGQSNPWAPGSSRFSGLAQRGSQLAHLRISDSVAGYFHRKVRFRVTERGLLGRGSHPLDGKPNFRKLSHRPSFLRTSLSWSHRLRSGGPVRSFG